MLAVIFDNLCREMFVDHAQMGHVGQRVDHLRLGQRPSGPIGKTRRLIKRLVRDFLHKRLIADLFAKAAHHGGNLRIKHRLGENAAFDKEDFQILTCRVKHLDRRLVTKQIIKRFHRHRVPGDGVNQNGVTV